jgi:hypothetical protein
LSDPWFDETNGELDRPQVLLQIADAYRKNLGMEPKEVWVDHTPHNIRHCQLLAAQFPSSKFIHVIRDGRAVAASVIPLDWGPNSIVDAAHFWIEQTAYGLAAEQVFGPSRLLRVRFEDLVTEPERWMRAICEFAELPFEPATLDGTGFQTPSYTRHQHAMIGKRPDPSRIWAWRERFSKRDHEIFESICEDFLEYLGYIRLFAYPTRGATFAEKLRIFSLGTLRKHISNPLRAALRRRARNEHRQP